MPLEECGVAYVSRSGKAVMIKFENPSSLFPAFLCINREQLKKVINDKKAEAKVMLVKR